MFNKKEITEIIFDALKARISKDLSDNWNSPLRDRVNNVVTEKAEEIESLLRESLDSVLGNKTFRDAIKEEFDRKVAKLLVAQLSGGIEQSINKFKQNPEIKARMILAIERIVNESDTTK